MSRCRTRPKWSKSDHFDRHSVGRLVPQQPERRSADPVRIATASCPAIAIRERFGCNRLCQPEMDDRCRSKSAASMAFWCRNCQIALSRTRNRRLKNRVKQKRGDTRPLLRVCRSFWRLTSEFQHSECLITASRTIDSLMGPNSRFLVRLKVIWQFLCQKIIDAADFGRHRSSISGGLTRFHQNRSQMAVDGGDADAMRTGSADRRSGCCETRRPSQCL